MGTNPGNKKCGKCGNFHFHDIPEACQPAVASNSYGARCSKCGSENVKTRHVAAGTLINSSSTAKVDTEFVASSEYDYFFKLTAKSEHLFKTCECGYSWRGRVAP